MRPDIKKRKKEEKRIEKGIEDNIQCGLLDSRQVQTHTSMYTQHMNVIVLF